MDAGFFQKFSKLQSFSKPTADDFFDKFNYKYTGCILMILLAVTGMRSYYQPLQCWIPPEWPKPWEQYAENYCWIQDTYYVNVSNSQFPKAGDRRITQISYYQWVPFVMAIQAFLFYLPHLMWKMLCVKAGYDVTQIVQFADKTATMNVEDRKKNIEFFAKSLNRTFKSRHWTPKMEACGKTVGPVMQKILPCFWVMGNHSAFLIGLYITIKALYIVNAIGQLFLMKGFLGFESIAFGWRAAANLVGGNHWTATGMFPRVTFCDVPIREVGQPVVRTIQCVLPINLLNEKTYIFIWFMTVACLIVSTLGLILWIIRAVLHRNKEHFIKRHLKLMQNNVNRPRGEKFVKEFLRNDGVFILRMIASNVGDIVAAEILEEVWKTWQKEEDAKNKKDDGDDETPSIVRKTPPPDENSEAPTMRRPNKGDSPISSI